jgi:hypothetical protein
VEFIKDPSNGLPGLRGVEPIELPSVALRSANLRIQGNGQGAVSTSAYLAELPSLVREISAGTIAVKPNLVSLADVEAIWCRPDPPGERTVLVP